MEGQEKKLNDNEFIILDEMCFPFHYKGVIDLLTDENIAYISLCALLERKLIQAYYPTPDEEVNLELYNFKDYYKDYYYLATKKGLKVLFG